MKIINISKNTILATDAKKAITFVDRVLGLLDKNNPRTLIFDTHFGIHTFGLDSEIDILLLDSQNKVVKIGNKVKPNSLFIYNPIYHLVVELMPGVIKKSSTKLNDKIIFE